MFFKKGKEELDGMPLVILVNFVNQKNLSTTPRDKVNQRTGEKPVVTLVGIPS